MSARLSTTPNFNPRSLTGATRCMTLTLLSVAFQSTLPHGSEQPSLADQTFAEISIHAPLRERLPYGSELLHLSQPGMLLFQSTLPYGSDLYLIVIFDDV